jgi:hypothetical protein
LEPSVFITVEQFVELEAFRESRKSASNTEVAMFIEAVRSTAVPTLAFTAALFGPSPWLTNTALTLYHQVSPPVKPLWVYAAPELMSESRV